LTTTARIEKSPKSLVSAPFRAPKGAEVQAARLLYDLIEARHCALREPVLTKGVKNARRDGVERVIRHWESLA
jgi:hypothetical protein